MTSRNDATRLTIRTWDPRQPRSVVARQGQVLLDADLDAQSRHLLHRVETATDDTLGSGGRLVVAAGHSAFQVTAAATPDACGIGPGHGFLGGWLVENATDDCLLSTQPHPRTETTPTGQVLLVLKALVRYVDPVEEPAFADPALGDAQAAGRALIDWQVFPFAPTGGWGPDFGCATVTQHPEWVRLTQPSSGTLTVLPDEAPGTSDPCSLTPQGGFSRPENLLYRIEVHGGVPRTDHPDVDGPRFRMDGLKVKLSRRNASVLATITEASGTDVSVEPAALDPLNWFAPGTYAEFVSPHDDVDPRDAADPAQERLFQVARATDTLITLEAAATHMADRVKKKPEGWFLRLWDAFPLPQGTGVATAKASTDPRQSEPIDLGDGLSIRLGAGTDDVFRRGDHWTFAARADGSIDWPEGQAEQPHGPEIRYAPLAVLTSAPSSEDCRIPAASLTDRTLLYRGGDGQQVAVPAGGGHELLPGRLRVAVMRGRAPVSGARVTWSMPAGGTASLINDTVVDANHQVTTVTADGLCAVEWKIDSTVSASTHQVQAVLEPAAGEVEGPPLVFTAGFLPAGGTVEPPSLSLAAIQLNGPNGTVELVREDHILNGLEVPYDAFTKEIVLRVDPPTPKWLLEAKFLEFDPIVEVELDLPYPITDPDRIYWAQATGGPPGSPAVFSAFGFQRVRLDGKVELDLRPRTRTTVVWRPSAMAKAFLESAPQHGWGNTIADQNRKELESAGWKPVDLQRILCRLRVRSAHVWARDPQTKRQVYLNAEHLGVIGRTTGRELLVKERDPQRAADLDLFFYLRSP
ncbi:hypothetical protein AQJ23_17345 [Streptomyces antibioticus]|nr:DUF6519 domain-containing protein [Streptomyces antibioticus]KUN25131.1 hypothetical protein AQJ23_17345 [Streptomyces antibioticus]